MNRNYHAFCAILLAFVLILVMCNQFVKDNSAKAAEQKVVYLTFDDGPSDRVTPKILDILSEENVKATFFIVGKAAENRKYLLKREVSEGHSIGVHSYSHRYSDIYSSKENLISDIDKCNELIKSVTGNYSTLYRFPGGSFALNEELIGAVREHGLTFVDWNASVCDAEMQYSSPYDLYKNAIETSRGRNRVVLLAHDSTTKISTAYALKDIIEYFKDNGFAFATL